MSVATDWYGGLEPELDMQMLPGKPADPEMREGASMWLFEENGAFGLPRVGVEAQGARWENHRYDVNAAFRGGRIMRASTRGPTRSPLAPDGSASILGAGGLQFQCIEPFRRWQVSYDGAIYEARIEDQIHGAFRVFADATDNPPLQSTTLKFDVDLTMAAPAWTQDYRPEKLARLSAGERADADLMGIGWRVEQLFRGEGTLTVDGQTRAFKGLGSRIHRQSVRQLGTHRGHCWQSAVFPDGRAFSVISYPPTDDGREYSIGYVYQNGKMHPARATKIPFLRNITPEGDDVSLELESAHGTTRISGVTTLGTFHMGNPALHSMHNHQGGVFYSWDGQNSIGMIERSADASLTRILI